MGWIGAGLGCVGAGRRVVALRRSGAVGWRASGIPQGGVYPRVGDVLAVIEALGVDAEQDFDAVPGPLGDPWRRHPGRQPERYRRVTQVVGPSGQGRGDLGRGQGQGPGLGPHVADRCRGDGVAPFAAEDPTVRCHAEGLDVRAEDGDQLGRDGHAAGLVGGPVLEPAFVVGRVGVGPAPVDFGTGLLQGEPPLSGRRQVAVLAA